MQVSPIPTKKIAHLDYAATRDNATILICRNGRVDMIISQAVVGAARFQRMIDALENQQSYDSLKLIVEDVSALV